MSELQSVKERIKWYVDGCDDLRILRCILAFIMGMRRNKNL